MSKFFEDVRIGEQAFLGSHTFTPDDIIAFARRYDPQPFHIDADLAERSFYGGLIASGWHSAAVCMRLWIGFTQDQDKTAALVPGERQPRLGPSPGIEALRWLLPIRAGDTISYSTRVAKKTELRSRPQWGLILSRFTGINQHGEEAISYSGQVFVERRGGGQRG